MFKEMGRAPPRFMGLWSTATTFATIAILAVASGRAAAQPQTLTLMVAAVAADVGIAPELLGAIVWVESRGWPWALNINGSLLRPYTRAKAAALVRARSGHADIGLAQIHYPIWGPVFGLQPEDLLDPWTNLHVAAVILKHARGQAPGSGGGLGRYHSSTPWRKWGYARNVATVVRALRAPRLGSDRAPSP